MSGSVGEVRWDSPAFDAGVGTGMSVVAVNDIAYGKEVMEDAIKAAKDDKAPIRLLVNTFDRYRTLHVDYHRGLRHPPLQLIEGPPAYLTDTLSPLQSFRRPRRSGPRLPRPLLLPLTHHP